MKEIDYYVYEDILLGYVMVSVWPSFVVNALDKSYYCMSRECVTIYVYVCVSEGTQVCVKLSICACKCECAPMYLSEECASNSR